MRLEWGQNFEVKTNFSGRSVSKKYVWRVMVQIKFTEELSLTLMLVVMVVCGSGRGDTMFTSKSVSIRYMRG